MDAVKDVTSHSAFTAYRDTYLLRNRLLVLEQLDKLKTLIADHSLTERVESPGQAYAHYRECSESCHRDDDHYDCVDTCVCCYVDMYKFRILQLLEQIECDGSRGLFKRCKDWIQRQLPWRRHRMQI